MWSGPSSNVRATRRVVAGPRRMTPGNASNTAFLTNARTVAGTPSFIRAIAPRDKRVSTATTMMQWPGCGHRVTRRSLCVEVGAVAVAQRVLLKLSGRGPRDGLDHLERVRHPELGELRGQVGAEVIDRRAGARLENV